MRFKHCLLVVLTALIFTPLFAQAENAQVELTMVDMGWPDVKVILEALSGRPIDDQITESVGKFTLHYAQPTTKDGAYSILTQLLLLHGVKLETQEGDCAKTIATSCPPMTAKELRYLPLRKRVPQLFNELRQDETKAVKMVLTNLDARALTLNLQALTQQTVMYNWLPPTKINYISEGEITRLAVVEAIDNWLMQNGIILIEDNNCLLALPINETAPSKGHPQRETVRRIVPRGVQPVNAP